MKSIAIFVLFLTSITGNTASLECALFRNNNDNDLIAKTDSKFPDKGSVSISEQDNILNNPEISRYAFSAKVENGNLVSVRLTDKIQGIATEHRTFEGNLMKVTLETKGMISNLECWMFN